MVFYYQHRQKIEDVASIVGKVIDMGDDAYPAEDQNLPKGLGVKKAIGCYCLNTQVIDLSVIMLK